MLATIHDDTWNTLNMQHITPNSKNGIIQTSLVMVLENIKGLAHMVEDYYFNKVNSKVFGYRRNLLVHFYSLFIWEFPDLASHRRTAIHSSSPDQLSLQRTPGPPFTNMD